MGTQDYFKKLEKNIDEDYKESTLPLKIAKHYSLIALTTGAMITAIAAPFLGLYFMFSIHSFEVKAKQEARQEISRFKEEYRKECQEKLRTETEALDAREEKLDKIAYELSKKKSDLYAKELDLESQERLFDFDKRHFESSKTWLESSEKRLKSKEKSFDSMFRARDNLLEARAKELDGVEKKLEGLFLCAVQNSLPFAQAFDLNGNYVLDHVDAEISKRFIGGIPVLSDEYAEAVRYIYSPRIIKNLERYGVNSHVLCVNETTLVVPKGLGIVQVIENVPPELLHDFVVNPKGSRGIDEILCNKKASSCNPVFLDTPGKYCGSGFVLGNNYIATAHHVAMHLEAGSYAQFEDGKKIEISNDSVVAYSEEHDIAILKCDFTGYEPVSLQENPSPESIIFMPRSQHSKNIEKGKTINGVLRRIEHVCFSSIMSAPDEIPKINGTDRYIASLDGYPGDSGSAVLNQNGEVVGIAVGCYKGCSEAANIVRAKYVKKLLEFYNKSN